MDAVREAGPLKRHDALVELRVAALVDGEGEVPAAEQPGGRRLLLLRQDRVYLVLVEGGIAAQVPRAGHVRNQKTYGAFAACL